MSIQSETDTSRDTSYVALIYFHGMGTPRRHEEISRLTDALDQYSSHLDSGSVGRLREQKVLYEPSRTEDEEDVAFVQITRVVNQRFTDYFSQLDAWELLQSISFGPLSLTYKLLRSEISNPIAAKFGLHRDVFASMLFTLKTLRNACAHHEPMWNWNRAWAQIDFPQKFRGDAKISDENKTKIYACCAALHILLGVLSSGQSSWYRRLKKLVNEFDTLDAISMGFPADWQTMPFWCVADVRKMEQVRLVRTKVRAESQPYEKTPL